MSRALLVAEDMMMNKTGYSPGLQKLMDWRRSRPWSWDLCPVALKAQKTFSEPRPEGVLSAPSRMVLGGLERPLCLFSSLGLQILIWEKG